MVSLFKTVICCRAQYIPFKDWGHHSYLSATMGSTRVARRAGT